MRSTVTPPGTSALNKWKLPIPRAGKIAIESSMIPIPPNHWVRFRQNRIPRGIESILVRIVAPVVVNPLMLSKKASINSGQAPDR